MSGWPVMPILPAQLAASSLPHPPQQSKLRETPGLVLSAIAKQVGSPFLLPTPLSIFYFWGNCILISILIMNYDFTIVFPAFVILPVLCKMKTEFTPIS